MIGTTLKRVQLIRSQLYTHFLFNSHLKCEESGADARDAFDDADVGALTQRQQLALVQPLRRGFLAFLSREHLNNQHNSTEIL